MHDMTLVVFWIVLSILILVHEFGHFIIAKKSGVLVEEFGIGYPPRIFGFKIGETIYSVNLLPIGGFVRLFGEERVEEKSNAKILRRPETSHSFRSAQDDKADIKSLSALSNKDKRAFFNQSLLTKVLVVVGGVAMNALLAVVIFSGVYSITGIPETGDQVVVLSVEPGSPAETAELEIGDEIIEVRSQNPEFRSQESEVSPSTKLRTRIQKLDDFSNFVKAHGGEEVEVLVMRGKDELWLTLVPRVNYPADQGPTGVTITYGVREVWYPWWQMPFRGTWAGMQEAFGWTILIVDTLGKMAGQWIFGGVVPKDVGGIVEVYHVTKQVIPMGLVSVLRLTGILSINLAVINLLPFPALDGGRLAVILLEGITRRKLRTDIEHYLNLIGFFILILLVILITINDVNRRYGDTWWVGRIRELVPK